MGGKPQKGLTKMILKWWESEKTEQSGHRNPLLALQLPSIPAIATIPGDFRQYDKMAQVQFKEDSLLLLLTIPLNKYY